MTHSRISPDTLRAYATIFESKRRDPVSGTLRPPGEACQAAAQCLRQVASSGDQVMKKLEYYSHHKHPDQLYEVIGEGKAQAREPLTDMEEVVIYRSVEDGNIWVRRKSEFEDGRFKRE